LVVGVAKYKHPKIRRLSLSDKDARDFAEFLKRQTKLFRSVHVTLLRNENATRSEIEKQLYYNLRRAGKDDTIILFFSGHGADDPNLPGEFFFLTHDAEPEFLAATALHMNRQWFLQKLDSKRVVVIADACHAGGFASKETKSGQPSIENFMRQFKESEGKVLVTSSRPDELSMEKPRLPNSVFTHYLLLGLRGEADADKDRVITLKELYDYVYENTKNETNGVQHPQWEGRLVGILPMALVEHATKTDLPADPRLQGSLEYQYHLVAAEEGDAEAQYQLGLTYLTGNGISKDHRQALKWLFKSAKQGNAKAQLKLASISLEGQIVRKDYAEAAKWFRLAAEQGESEAQLKLGHLYFNGQGLKRDLSEALKWFHQAAQQEDVESQLALADMYVSGHGVPKDCHEAEKWCLKAAQTGSERATHKLREIKVACAGPAETTSEVQPERGKTEERQPEKVSPTEPPKGQPDPVAAKRKPEEPTKERSGGEIQQPGVGTSGDSTCHCCWQDDETGGLSRRWGPTLCKRLSRDACVRSRGECRAGEEQADTAATKNKSGEPKESLFGSGVQQPVLQQSKTGQCRCCFRGWGPGDSRWPASYCRPMSREECARRDGQVEGCD